MQLLYGFSGALHKLIVELFAVDDEIDLSE